MNNADSLRKYLKAVVSLDSTDPDIEEKTADLKAKFRLSFGDREKIRNLIEHHRIRANQYMEEDREHGAIVELQRACDIDPLETEDRVRLSRIHALRWDRWGRKRDFRRALRLLEEAESLEASKAEIKEIRGILKIKPQKKRTKKGWIRLGVGIILGLTVVVSVGTLLSDFLSAPSVSTNNPPVNGPEKVNTEEMEGYEVEIIHSSITPLDTGYAYELSGIMVPKERNLTHMALSLRFIDADLVPSSPITIPLLDETDPPVGPGEELIIAYREIARQAVPELSEIFLDIEQEQSHALISTSPPRPVDFRWETPRPNGIECRIAEKGVRSRSTFDGEVRQILFRIESVGTRPISYMAIDVEWRDSQGNRIEEQQQTIIPENLPALKPGRARSFMIEAPETTANADYLLKVIEVE